MKLGIKRYPNCTWSAIARKAGLQRCGKSCRRRWMNHLRPHLKRGKFGVEEIQLIMELRDVVGNRWSEIASHLPGRTDNDVKNLWYAILKKKRSESRKQLLRHDHEILPWDTPSVSSAADGNNVKLEIGTEEDSSSRTRDVQNANSTNVTGEFAYTGSSSVMEMQTQLRSNNHKFIELEFKGQPISTDSDQTLCGHNIECATARAVCEASFDLPQCEALQTLKQSCQPIDILITRRSDSTPCSTIGASSCLDSLVEELGLQSSDDDQSFITEQNAARQCQDTRTTTSMLDTYNSLVTHQGPRYIEGSQDTFWQDILCSLEEHLH